MTVRYLLAAVAALAASALPHGLAAETLKIASPIRGSWEGAIPELGKQAGIFQKHGLDLEILDRIRRNIVNTRTSTGPYRARLRTVADGEAAPGISAVLMPGHTPGHTGWLIQSGNDGLLVWGDLVHLAAVQVARPDTGLIYDVDPQTACATRKRMFDRVAADKLKVAGAHLDFPGFGTIARKGAGFAFEPDA